MTLKSASLLILDCVAVPSAGSMVTCQSDYAAYLGAVTAGGDTAPTYSFLYAHCHTMAAVLTPVKAASMATPTDAGSAQAAAALVASAVAGLPDLTVSPPCPGKPTMPRERSAGTSRSVQRLASLASPAQFVIILQPLACCARRALIVP